MKRVFLFVFVGGILASCINISPTPKFSNVSLEQRKCVSVYKTFVIKKCNYEENKDLCYKIHLSKMRDLIYKDCGVDITN